jgi:hypothetical protein
MRLLLLRLRLIAPQHPVQECALLFRLLRTRRHERRSRFGSIRNFKEKTGNRVGGL